MSYTFQPTGKPYAIQQGPDAEKIDHNFDILFAELRRFNTQVGDNIGASTSTLPDPVTPAHGGTGITSYTQGDLLYASNATTLSKLADVAAGSYLRSGGVGANPVWSTVTLPNSATTGDILYASASNVYSNLAAVAAGKVLRAAGVATAPAYSTFTIPDTFAQGDLIYGSASNVLSALAKDTNATRYLANTGTSNNPKWDFVDLTNGVTGILPIANGGSGSSVGPWPPPTRWIGFHEMNGAVFATGGTTKTNLGFGAMATSTSAGTEGTVVDTNGSWDRLTTGATTGNGGRYSSNGEVSWTYLDHQPTFVTRIRTNSSISAFRIWVALVDANLTNSDNQAARKGVGAVYSTVRGDSGWLTWKSDGTTQTVGTQIATIAASTIYQITIAVGASNTVITINGLSQTITNPSISGVGLWGAVIFFTTENVTKGIDWHQFYGERNGN